MILKDRLEFAQNIIESYEHIRNNGTQEDIKEIYNKIGELEKTSQRNETNIKWIMKKNGFKNGN